MGACVLVRVYISVKKNCNEDFLYIIREKEETVAVVVFSHIGFPPKILVFYVLGITIAIRAKSAGVS